MDLLKKHFPEINCPNCLVNKNDGDINGECIECSENYEYERFPDRGYTCEFHMQELCEKCYGGKVEDYKIFGGILSEIIKSRDKQEFIEVCGILKPFGPDYEKGLSMALFDCISAGMFEKAQYLIDEFGADINYVYNSNILLPNWLDFRPDCMEFLSKNNYDFLQRCAHGENSLDWQIYDFISSRKSIDDVEKMLKYIDIKHFNIGTISGCEYGGDKYYLRRQKINKLIKMGIVYDLDAKIRNKRLRNTRLGYYLVHREFMAHFRKLQEK